MMIRTRKQSPLVSTDTFDRIARRRRQLRALNILLLIILLGLFTLGFDRVIAYESDITRSTFTVQGAFPVPVLAMRPNQGDTGIVAIVAHGFSGSKDLMTGFGVELAHAGVTAYLLDFPGHGTSPVALSGGSYTQSNARDNVTAIDEVVSYVRSTRHSRIILLGHSMGSAAVGDYAMLHSNDSDIISTILISPVGQELPTPTQPKNLLMLVGQNDIPSTLTNSTRLLRLGCDLPDAQPVPQECGNPANGTGRRVVVLPGLNHITILNASSTFQEVLNWQHRATPQVDNTHMNSNVRLFWLLLGIVAILLAIFPLSALLVNIFDVNPKAKAFHGRDVLIFDLCLLVGIAAAIGIQYMWRPFSFVSILLADYVSGYFFFTAVITALLIFALRRVLPLPSLEQPVRQFLIGLSLAALLYFTLGQLATFAWQRFSFTLPRLWRFAVIFLLVLPAFLLDEGINRGYQEKGIIRGVVASLGFKALLVAGLVASLVVIPGLGFLSIVLPVLVLIFLLLVGFCTQLYGNGRAAFAAAVLSAAVIAWSMSTTFPITG